MVDELHSLKPKAFFIHYTMKYLFENREKTMQLVRIKDNPKDCAAIIIHNPDFTSEEYFLSKDDLFEIIGVLLKIQSDVKKNRDGASL